MASRIIAYTLRVMGPDNIEREDENWQEEIDMILDNFAGEVSKMEEVLNEQLPEGYYCKVDES